MEPNRSPIAGGIPTEPSDQISPTRQSMDAVIKNEPTASHHETEPQDQKSPSWTTLKGLASFVAFIGGVLLTAFLINQFIFQSYFVDGTSMVPTLQNSDRLIIDKVSKTIAHIQGKEFMPERGQIVVLDSDLIAANGSQEQLVKRVIGLPGDKIVIENGEVTIYNDQNPDGFDIDKQLELNLPPTYSAARQEYSVPDGQVFVMGDNRTQNGSHDSRAFGSVAFKDLEGRLWARIWPPNQAKLFP